MIFTRVTIVMKSWSIVKWYGAISEYMEKGFDFLQMMIDKGYMNPDRALETLPKKEEEKSFFANGNCAFICAIYSGKALEGYPFEIAMTPLPVLEMDLSALWERIREWQSIRGQNIWTRPLPLWKRWGRQKPLTPLPKTREGYPLLKNATAPDIPQTDSLIACISRRQTDSKSGFQPEF